MVDPEPKVGGGTVFKRTASFFEPVIFFWFVVTLDATTNSSLGMTPVYAAAVVTAAHTTFLMLTLRTAETRGWLRAGEEIDYSVRRNRPVGASIVAIIVVIAGFAAILTSGTSHSYVWVAFAVLWILVILSPRNPKLGGLRSVARQDPH